MEKKDVYRHAKICCFKKKEKTINCEKGKFCESVACC